MIAAVLSESSARDVWDRGDQKWTAMYLLKGPFPKFARASNILHCETVFLAMGPLKAPPVAVNCSQSIPHLTTVTPLQ